MLDRDSISRHQLPRWLPPCFAALALMAGIMIVPGRHLSQTSFVLAGRVLDEASKLPLDEVDLSVSSASGTTTLVAGADGSFRLELPRAGRYFVIPTRKGFVYPSRRATPNQHGVWVDVGSDRETDNIEIRMVAESSIAGQVLAPDGTPAVKVPVSLLRYSYSEQGRRQLLTAEVGGAFAVPTNDRGEYRFFGISPGAYYVRVHSPAPAGRWAALYHPGTTEEHRALPVVVGSGENLRVSPMTLIQRDTVKVTLRFPPSAVPGQWSDSKSLHFPDGSTLSQLGGGSDWELELARDVYDVEVSWGGTRGKNFAGAMRLDTSQGEVRREIASAAMVTVKMSLETPPDAAFAASGFKCTFRSRVYVPVACSGESRVPPGVYDLKIEGLPQDAYVASAEGSGLNLLSGSITLEKDAILTLAIRTPGSRVQGRVHDTGGIASPHATVVLVPDDPQRKVDFRYRSTMTDIHGHFELLGIAPGSYRLFAWEDLEGTAYFNEEFMKAFEDRGERIEVEANQRLSQDLRVLSPAVVEGR